MGMSSLVRHARQRNLLEAERAAAETFFVSEIFRVPRSAKKFKDMPTKPWAWHPARERPAGEMGPGCHPLALNGHIFNLELCEAERHGRGGGARCRDVRIRQHLTTATRSEFDTIPAELG
jgi:hypothetical protein